MQLSYCQKRKCKYCGNEFEPLIYNVRKGFGNYCSKTCSNRGNNLGFKKGHPSLLSEESKIKIGNFWRGKKLSVERREKLRQVNIGKKLTDEHKNKISVAKKGKKLSEEHRINIIKSTIFQKGHKINLGKIFPHKGSYIECPNCKKKFYVNKKSIGVRKYCSKECLFSSTEWRDSISNRLKGIKRRPLSDEEKMRLSLALSGNKSYLWKGGKSFEPYPINWNNLLKKLIRIRDNYTCFICKNVGKYVHHIDYNKKNCEPINLITLCLSCHVKTNHNRNYWEDYFRTFKYPDAIEHLHLINN